MARRDALPTRSKIAIVARSWWYFVSIRVELLRRPLPDVVRGLEVSEAARRRPVRAVRLGRMVHRSLTIGPLRTRCLYTSLVVYRMLHDQGDDPTLVLGLPERPEDKDAHAWIEVAGADVGPPPGGAGYVELARYG
jgi:hypothetical protein